MKWNNIISTKLVLLVLLLAVAVVAVPVSADSNVNGPFTPPAYGVISVSNDIDNVFPNAEIAESFLESSTGREVLGWIIGSAESSESSVDNRTLVLHDFPYYNQNDELQIRDISVSELLSSIRTPFTGYGWGSSYATHEYIEISVGTPAWKTDLKNVYYLIQAMAELNGFTEPIPVLFANIQIIVDNQSIQTPSDLRAKTDKFRPLIGGIESITGPITVSEGIMSSRSTLGFSVKFSSGTYGIITSGHGNPTGTLIYQPGSTMSSNKIGSITERYLNGVDAALITCDSGIQSKGSINGQPWNPGGEIIDIHSYGSIDTTKPFKFSGVTSGNVGNLAYVGTQSHTYPSKPLCDPQPVTIDNAIIITGTSSDGDSGAPVYQNYDGILPDWNNKLVGILSGHGTATYNDGTTGPVIIVQPIQPILNKLQSDGYSLTVLTNGNT